MSLVPYLQTGSGPSSGFSAFTLTHGALTGVPPNEYLAPLNFIGLDAPPSPTALYPEPAPWLLFSNVAGAQAEFCAVVSILYPNPNSPFPRDPVNQAN